MPENTPDRLKAFRAEYDQNNGRGARWTKIQFGVLIAGILVLILLQFPGIRQMAGIHDTPSAANVERQRELAVYLAEKNQPRAALQAYETYLAHASLDGEARAKVCYAAAKLAMDIDEYDAALKYLYEAELAAPDSAIKPDINNKIIHCLDRLNRPEALRRELRARGNARQTGGGQSMGVVLAEFGGEVITDRDLEGELDQLPPPARNAITTPDEKAAFLKNLVAERLLLDKARRLELDRDPEVQSLLARQVDSLIVRKLIDDEVRAKMYVTVEDAERFYLAEIHRFTTPASAVGVLGAGATREEALAAAGRGRGRITIRQDAITGAAVPDPVAANLMESVLAMTPGEVAHETEAGGTWYAFRGTLSEAVTMPFETVRQQATELYRVHKEQELIQALIESTLQARQVKLYPERLAAGETP